MPSEVLVTDYVNIGECPKLDALAQAGEGVQITLGDLHANAVKFLYFLIRHGVIKNLANADYQRFVQIYLTPVADLTSKDLTHLYVILQKAAYQKNSFIRLIGDELADRGRIDYLILQLYKWLFLNGVKVETLLSNHGIEFILAYEQNLSFNPTILGKRLTPSMTALQSMIQAGLVPKQELKELIECYQPTLKLLSYSLNDAEDEISIYSHAAIGIEHIAYLAAKFDVAYDDATPAALAASIERINAIFMEHVKNHTVHTLVDEKVMRDGYGLKNICPQQNPIEFLLWNRRYDIIDRPAFHRNYKVYFIHGHDSDEKSHDNIYNLDNQLGKRPGVFQGHYNAFYCDHHFLSTDSAANEAQVKRANKIITKTVPAPSPDSHEEKLEQILSGYDINPENWHAVEQVQEVSSDDGRPPILTSRKPPVSLEHKKMSLRRKIMRLGKRH